MIVTVNDRSLSCIGDSQLDEFRIGSIPPHFQYPKLIADYIGDASGKPVKARNHGHSGDTSLTCVGRALDVLGERDAIWIPTFGLIQPGVNDPGNGINQATTQLYLQVLAKVFKHGGPEQQLLRQVYAANPAALPGYQEIGSRCVILSDDSGTGGWDVDAAVAGAGGNALTVWECVGYKGGERGWRRLTAVDGSTLPDTCSRLIFIGAPYLNFTTGGDSPGAPFATYVPVRAAQAAAAAAEQGVNADGTPVTVFVDVYNFMRDRIVAGTDLDFTAVSYDQTRSWHYTQNNQHFSYYGDELVAAATNAAIQAQAPGWLE